MIRIKKRRTCRICKSSALSSVLDLGKQYLSNLFVIQGMSPPTTRFPLELIRCRKCGFVQLRHTVPGEVLYRQYWYKSGVNQSMQIALRDIVRSAEKITKPQKGDVVLDIGCNDCTLLKQYRNKSLRRFGMDPARNISRAEDRKGITVLQDFFDGRSFLKKAKKKARIITSIAMFYDLEDPKAFTDGIAHALEDDGIWILQMSYLPLMLSQNAFDNICHEHLGYYSLEVLEKVIRSSGLEVFDVELNDVNGGSLRAYVQHRGAKRRQSSRLIRLRRFESRGRFNSPAPYRAFTKRVSSIRKRLKAFAVRAKKRGQTIAGYGASTKGNVLLQYCGFTPKEIPYIADRNPRKWGAKTLGTAIPIVSEAEARQRLPEFLLVLPWHFLPEFLSREKPYLRRGGSLIVPMPRFTVINKQNASRHRGWIRSKNILSKR